MARHDEYGRLHERHRSHRPRFAGVITQQFQRNLNTQVEYALSPIATKRQVQANQRRQKALQEYNEQRLMSLKQHYDNELIATRHEYTDKLGGIEMERTRLQQTLTQLRSRLSNAENIESRVNEHAATLRSYAGRGAALQNQINDYRDRIMLLEIQAAAAKKPSEKNRLTREVKRLDNERGALANELAIIRDDRDSTRLLLDQERAKLKGQTEIQDEINKTENQLRKLDAEKAEAETALSRDVEDITNEANEKAAEQLTELQRREANIDRVSRRTHV